MHRESWEAVSKWTLGMTLCSGRVPLWAVLSVGHALHHVTSSKSFPWRSQYEDVLFVLLAYFPGFPFLALQMPVWLNRPWLCCVLPPGIWVIFYHLVHRPWLPNSLPRITGWMKPNAVVLELCWINIGVIVWTQCVKCFPCHWTMKAASLWLRWKTSIWRLMTGFWGVHIT